MLTEQELVEIKKLNKATIDFYKSINTGSDHEPEHPSTAVIERLLETVEELKAENQKFIQDIVTSGPTRAEKILEKALELACAYYSPYPSLNSAAVTIEDMWKEKANTFIEAAKKEVGE